MNMSIPYVYLVIITVSSIALSVVVLSFPSYYKSTSKTHIRYWFISVIIILFVLSIRYYSEDMRPDGYEFNENEASIGFTGFTRIVMPTFIAVAAFLSFPKYKSQKHFAIRLLIYFICTLFIPYIFWLFS